MEKYIDNDPRDMVVLVKVAPYRKAEQIFMNDLETLKKRLRITEYAVRLSSLFFEQQTIHGEPYNMYVLSFKTDIDCQDAFDWLREYFFNMTIENKEFLDNEPGEMLPNVVMAYVNKE